MFWRLKHKMIITTDHKNGNTGWLSSNSSVIVFVPPMAHGSRFAIKGPISRNGLQYFPPPHQLDYYQGPVPLFFLPFLAFIVSASKDTVVFLDIH